MLRQVSSVSLPREQHARQRCMHDQFVDGPLLGICNGRTWMHDRYLAHRFCRSPGAPFDLCFARPCTFTMAAVARSRHCTQREGANVRSSAFPGHFQPALEFEFGFEFGIVLEEASSGTVMDISIVQKFSGTKVSIRAPPQTTPTLSSQRMRAWWRLFAACVRAAACLLRGLNYWGVEGGYWGTAAPAPYVTLRV